LSVAATDLVILPHKIRLSPSISHDIPMTFPNRAWKSRSHCSGQPGSSHHYHSVILWIRMSLCHLCHSPILIRFWFPY
jgi:hypothetical protein